MPRVILGVILGVYLSSAPASAQVPDHPNGCATCQVYAYVDNLELNRVPVVSRATVWEIPGWGFQCFDGQPITRVDVSYWVPAAGKTLAGWQAALGTYEVEHGPRPDVVAHVLGLGLCPSLAWRDDTGFTAFYRETWRIPAGVQDVRFVLWRGPYKTEQIRRIRFIN